MFLDYYGLREQPFGVTPNPRFLFPSPSHREVLASLLYAIQSDLGFSALIADPGMGKTTLLFDLLDRYRNSANTAFLFHTQCNSQDLLRYFLTELGVETDGHDSFLMHEKFKEVLLKSLRENKKVLLVLDEAQDLDDSVLETVRLLSNFETSDSKLLHIILSGQTHLAQKLMSPGMAQLFQRIAILNRLKPLTHEETCAYVHHRLEVAGYSQGLLFTPNALAQISRYSQGVPRTINRLCFGSLSIACALNQRPIDENIVDEVREDLNLSSFVTSNSHNEVPLRIDPPKGRAAPASHSAGRPISFPPSKESPPARTERIHAEQQPPPPKLDIGLENVRNIASPQRPQGKAALRAQKKALAGSPSRVAETAFIIALLLLLLAVLVLPRIPEVNKISAKTPDTKLAENTATTTNAPDTKDDNSPPLQPVEVPKPQKRRPSAALGNAVANEEGSRVTRPSFGNSNSPLILPSPSDRTAPGTAKQNPPTPPSTQLEEPAPPPVNVVTSGRDSQPLASVMGNVLSTTPKVEPGTPPANASAEIVPGKLVIHPQPAYPDEAKRFGIEGTVILHAVVTKDGKLKNVRAIAGESRLASAAEVAVRKWQYTPYTIHGEPVEVDTEIRVNFNLQPK